MRIVVMGSGGTGGYFGAKLARAGEDVTFVARGAHLDAIRTHGLRVKSAAEGEWVVRAPVVERLDGLPPAEIARSESQDLPQKRKNSAGGRPANRSTTG